MQSHKEKLSITISKQYVDLVYAAAEDMNRPRSYVIEQALKMYFLSKLADDAKYLASLTWDGLPSEDDWAHIQSEAL